ncbi:MAG: sigma 54-interacting transcriptional regulator [Lentisphaeria bacterium]|nr:sigma 54-interacting transcriptional regulator [Lentisphaeria bacterium]
MLSGNFQLEILSRISQALAHSQDVDSLLQECLEILDTELGFRRGIFTLKHPDDAVLRIVASKGLSDEEVARGNYAVGEGVTGKVAETLEAELIPNISADDRFLGRTRSKQENLAFLCVPIIRQKELIGTLSIDRPPVDDEQLRKDLELLKTIANILGEAVGNLQHHLDEIESLTAENKQLRQALGAQYQPSNILGNCAVMKNVYNRIAQVANSPANVLIRGESGTGKELVARALHFSSTRKNGPFISVNIAALPENLVESELFGHEKGAFTGAVQQRLGRFEQANGGTLFMDEIGDISASVQVRLLRVLQERIFERVGGNDPIKVNVRILAATSRNLEDLMEEGIFREDLYYRLNIFPIHLPPLRERKSDIILLADFFLERSNETYNTKIKRISTTAINMMMSYHWPGNVRELENCIEHAVLTSADNVIHGFNLPPSVQTASDTHTEFVPLDGASLDTLLASYEREILVDSLKTHRGNCAGAARALGTTQRIFNYRIKKLKVEPKIYKT